MIVRLTLALGLPAWMFASLATGGSLGQDEATPSPVAYGIRAVEGEGPLALDIEMRFRGSDTGETSILLPIDRYGTPDLDEFVVEFEAHDGSDDGVDIEPGRRRAARRILHEPGADLSLRYRLAYDPTAHPHSAYRPDVGRDHFHFLGPQWMVRLDGEEAGAVERDFEIRFEDWPEDWAAFSSSGFGTEPHRTRASFDDLIPAVLGGGTYETDSFEIDGDWIHTAVREPIDVGSEELFRTVKSIVEYQRENFGSRGLGDFVVTLTPREGIRAGTSIRNAMICYLASTSSLQDIQILLAHEMFHQWLPVHAQVEPDDFAARFDWFDEGFTEYFARRLLLDQGLLELEEVIALFNRDLRELHRNPHVAMTNEELGEVHRNRTFTNIHYRLSYLRGALIALDWDARIRAHSGGERSLVDFMSGFIGEGLDRDGSVPVERFHGLLEAEGVDSRRDVARWIERAEVIRPDGTAFGSGHALRLSQLPELGFSREVSERHGLILGLKESGPAHAAGIRSRMPLHWIDAVFESNRVHLGLGGFEEDPTARTLTLVPSSWEEIYQYRRK